MQPALPLLTALTALTALLHLGCASAVKGPGGPGACTIDADCAAHGGGICTDGHCTTGLPIGGVPPEGEEGEGASGGEGEGAGGGVGEGASGGEGEGAGGGEGEGAGGGEGEGEGSSQSGAQTLLVSAGPELVNALPGCQCVANAPASNVDISFSAQSGGSCQKPADQSCGIDGGRCPCALSGTSWFVSRQEQPRTNEVWIVDEAVAQTAGADGVFTVRASVIDDCLLSPGSVDASVNQACFQLDCQGDIGGASACFDYTGLGANCGIASSNAATVATSADCMARGTVPVRVHVEAQGTGGFIREFCTDLAQGAAVDAVQLRRISGSYTVANVSSQLREVAVGAPCS